LSAGDLLRAERQSGSAVSVSSVDARTHIISIIIGIIIIIGIVIIIAIIIGIAGTLLMWEVAQNGELIESYIKAGKIVPVEITVNLLKEVRRCAVLCTRSALIAGAQGHGEECDEKVPHRRIPAQ
jgi:hypothetical protein